MSVTATPAPASPSTSSTVAPQPAAVGSIDALLLLMAAIWGGNFYAVQYGTAHMPGLAFNTSRMALGALAMLVLTIATVREPWPSRADTMRLLAYGALGNGIYQWFFVEGLSRSRGGSASLILASSPALLALMGWATRTETLTRVLLMGVVLSVSGVAMVMLGDNAVAAARGAGGWGGNALLVAAALSWAVYVTLLRPLTTRLNGLHLTLITLAGGLVPLLVLTGRDLAATEWASLGIRTWGAMAYSGFGAIVVAYVIYYHGLKKIGATRTSLYSNLQPFVAILVAWQFQHDTPTFWQVMGFLCITGGLLLARRKA